VKIEVWSDFACPWCALGQARLRAARWRFEHGDALQVVHRSYELDPRAPARRQLSMEEAVVRKYGMAPEQARAGHASMAELAREDGIVFHFDRVQLGSTFDAHRLVQAARGQFCEEAMIQAFFEAYFAQGRLLSDHTVLREIADAAGLESALIDRVLGGSLYAKEVHDDEAAALELGVTGVPFFLIDGSWPIPGAQDVDTMVTILTRAWARSQR
jgi:predicted DsbA family dithiol-disulfide isomerase